MNSESELEYIDVRRLYLLLVYLQNPQNVTLGPLLFNVYSIDMFHLMNGTEICNYADDTSFYPCDSEG